MTEASRRHTEISVLKVTLNVETTCLGSGEGVTDTEHLICEKGEGRELRDDPKQRD